jgi:hypothetical protein
MDTTTGIAIGIGILGVVVTCIFGWLALRRRYSGRITYFEESSIGLFDSIVRNIGDLKVLYKDEPVSKNVVLLKGYIMNTGYKDITQDMIEEPLALKLPDGFRWLDAKVVPSPTQVKASLTIRDAMTAEFDLGLFRENEHVKFEALAEVPTAHPESEIGKQESVNKKLKDSLKLVHRIADTQKVTTSELPPHMSFKNFIRNIAMGLSFWLLVDLFVLLVFQKKGLAGVGPYAWVLLALLFLVNVFISITVIDEWKEYKKTRKVRKSLSLE